MNKEELKKKIEEVLMSMGYTGISFSNGPEDLLVVSFNSNEITSFKADLPGWSYTGIQIDPSGKGQYKIEFRKIF